MAETPLYKISEQDVKTKTPAFEQEKGETARLFQRGRIEEAKEKGKEYERGKIGYDELSNFLIGRKEKAIGPFEKRDISGVQAGAEQLKFQEEETEMKGKYQRGEITYEDYKGFLDRVQERYAEGTLEEQRILEEKGAATTQEYQRQEQEMAGKYDRGEITYSEYFDFLNEAQKRYEPGTSEATRIENVEGKIREEQRKTQEQRFLDQYESGQVSFQDTIRHLNNRLGQYEEGTPEYNRILGKIDDVKATDYRRTEDTMRSQFETGQINFNRYKNFLQNAQKRYVPGTPEYTRIQNDIRQARDTRQSNKDVSMAGRFEREEIGYKKYKNYLEKRIDNTGVGTDEFARLQDALQKAGTKHIQIMDNDMEAKYNRKDINYNQYVKYLQRRMKATPKSDDSDYLNAWEDAYQSELDALDREMELANKTGRLRGKPFGDKDYANYLRWRGKKANKYRQNVKLPEYKFTPAATGGGGKPEGAGRQIANPREKRLFKESEMIEKGGKTYVKKGTGYKNRLSKHHIKNPDNVKFYKPNQVFKVLNTGKWYVKPGVKKDRWGFKEIKNPANEKFYKENEIVRARGKTYRKRGVPKRTASSPPRGAHHIKNSKNLKYYDPREIVKIRIGGKLKVYRRKGVPKRTRPKNAGSRIKNPANVKYFKESQLVREKDGKRVWVKKGLNKAKIRDRGKKIRIPNRKILSKYKESEIVRRGRKVFKKKGVPKRW